jgi:hypothetical protein
LVSLFLPSFRHFCNHGFLNHLDKSENTDFLAVECGSLENIQGGVDHILVVRETKAPDTRANSIEELIHVCEGSVDAVNSLDHHQQANHCTLPISVKDEVYFVCLSRQQPVDAFHYCWLAFCHSIFSQVLNALLKVFFNLLGSKSVAIISNVLDCQNDIGKRSLILL